MRGRRNGSLLTAAPANAVTTLPVGPRNQIITEYSLPSSDFDWNSREAVALILCRPFAHSEGGDLPAFPLLPGSTEPAVAALAMAGFLLINVGQIDPPT
jgi:hypothetical protein